MDTQRSLLTALLREGDLASVVDAGISANDFSEEVAASAFEFIRDHWIDHKKVPARSTVALDFPDVLLPDSEVPEPLSFYITELLNDVRYETLFEGLREVAGEIDTDERIDREVLDRAAARASIMLQEYHSRGGNLRSVDITQRASNWWDQYLIDAADNRSIKGIPLGIPALDHSLGGLRPQQLVTIIGLPKSGKSLMTLRAAVVANRWGYRPLFMSFEMSVQEQEERYHALNANVSLTRLQQGRLKSAERERIQRSFRYRERNMGGFIIAEDPHSMTTVTAVASQIETYEPDIVFIDGMYMMDDEKGEPPNSPQAITNNTRALKRLAQKANIPIVMTSQALFWKTSKRKGIGAESAGYSSSFQQDSDIFMGIDTDDEDQSIKTYKVILTRVGTPVTASYKWDFERTGVLLEVEDDAEVRHEVFDGSDV